MFRCHITLSAATLPQSQGRAGIQLETETDIISFLPRSTYSSALSQGRGFLPSFPQTHQWILGCFSIQNKVIKTEIKAGMNHGSRPLAASSLA